VVPREAAPGTEPGVPGSVDLRQCRALLLARGERDRATDHSDLGDGESHERFSAIRSAAGWRVRAPGSSSEICHDGAGGGDDAWASARHTVRPGLAGLFVPLGA
jgi:hypothetical protein